MRRSVRHTVFNDTPCDTWGKLNKVLNGTQQKGKTMRLTACTFRRETADSPREEGVMLDADRLIIDAEGKPVPFPVWDYELEPHRGCVIFELKQRE